MSDVAELMKRCQRGVGGRNALDEAHDIMAECYGTLGRLESERDALEAERDALRQQLAERDAELKKVNADRLSCWAEFKVMTRSCLEAEKQRDKLAGLLREAAGELRTDRHHGLRQKIDTALSELTP